MLHYLTRKCSKLVLISILCLVVGAVMKITGGSYLEPTASVLLGISGVGIMMSIFVEAIA